MTGVEVRYLHRDMLPFAWQPWIPIVVSGLCALACWGVAWRSSERTGLAVLLFVLGLVSGLYGFYLHSDGRLDRIGTLFEGRSARSDDEGEDREPEPPILAPLSLTGLSSIALATTARRRRDTFEETGRGIGSV